MTVACKSDLGHDRFGVLFLAGAYSQECVDFGLHVLALSVPQNSGAIHNGQCDLNSKGVVTPTPVR